MYEKQNWWANFDIVEKVRDISICKLFSCDMTLVELVINLIKCVYHQQETSFFFHFQNSLFIWIYLYYKSSDCFKSIERLFLHNSKFRNNKLQKSFWSNWLNLDLQCYILKLYNICRRILILLCKTFYAGRIYITRTNIALALKFTYFWVVHS